MRMRFLLSQMIAALCLLTLSGGLISFCPEPGHDLVLVTPEPPATIFTAEVTAYSSSPDETWGDPFITASGRRVFDGLIACPRAYPFGTQFRIGDRVYTCWDRLHERFDHRFDIWKTSKEEALEFGRRRLVVERL